MTEHTTLRASALVPAPVVGKIIQAIRWFVFHNTLTVYLVRRIFIIRHRLRGWEIPIPVFTSVTAYAYRCLISSTAAIGLEIFVLSNATRDSIYEESQMTVLYCLCDYLILFVNADFARGH